MLLVLGVLALAGCEKPTPQVTVFSGTSSVQDQAVCYAREDEPPVDVQQCLAGAGEDGVRSLDVIPGRTLGISVDVPVAEQQWIVLLDGQQFTQRPITDSTYRRFLVSDEFGAQGPALLQVRELGGDAEEVRGVWLFRLDAT